MRTALLLALLFIFGWLTTGTQSFAALSDFSFSLPQVTASFDDLDARDQMNRPVCTPAARATLRDIFQSGWYALLLSPELPSIAKALEHIRCHLNLAGRAIACPLPLMRAVVAVLGNSLRRTVRADVAPAAALRFLMAAFLALAFVSCRRVYPAAQTSPVFRC